MSLFIVMFVTLQFSRKLIVDGVCMIFWRRLCTGSFDFKASCDESGNMLRDRFEIRDSSFELRSKLNESLRFAFSWPGMCRSINSYGCSGCTRGLVRTGQLKLAAAVVIQAPWAALVMYVHQTIQFN